MSRNPTENSPSGIPVEMEGELRTAYRGLADASPVLSDLPGSVRKTVRKRRTRRYAAVGGTAVILVPVALVIGLSGGSRPQGDQQVIVSTPGPTVVTKTPAATARPTVTAAPRPSSELSPATPAATATATPSAVQTQPPGRPQNLPVTAAVRQQLIAAYEAGKGLPSDGVTGTSPGSVYYALDPATGVHWAFANFEASSTLTTQQYVSLQDGGE